MRRGELYRVFRPKHEGKEYRTFVVVSRQALIDSRFPELICAAVMTQGQGLATQLRIGLEEGMKHDSWIHCDDLRSLRKAELTSYVGSLGPAKMRNLDLALAVALDLPFNFQ
jgi:mRNA interferase MazF